MEYNNRVLDKAAESFEEIETISAAKRCGLNWNPWMGDWFTSHSPRNDNHNAEGTWDHWVDLAVKILQDPLTAIVRPEAHRAGWTLAVYGFYSETNRGLTDEELAERFKEAQT
jgi:hypothetical protein